MTWSVHEIAATLGASLVLGRATPPTYTLRLHNARLGVTLKVDLVPDLGGVCLFAERERSMRPRFIGRVDLVNLVRVEIDPQQHTVRFDAAAGQPSLILSAASTFRVIVD